MESFSKDEGLTGLFIFGIFMDALSENDVTGICPPTGPHVAPDLALPLSNRPSALDSHKNSLSQCEEIQRRRLNGENGDSTSCRCTCD